jgi:hypothetical protein
MVDLDNWLVGNPLVIPKFEVKKRTVAYGQAEQDNKEKVE